jgi:membrane protein
MVFKLREEGGMSMKKSWNVLKETAQNFSADRVLTLGAALAYYAIFSIGPLLVILVGVAGLVFSESQAKQEIIQQAQSVVGENAGRILQSMMAAQTRHGSLIATIIGVVVLLLGASGVFGQLKDSLNLLWGIQPKSGQAILRTILNKVFAILTVFAIGVLLVISMLFTTFVSGFTATIQQYVPVPNWFIHLVNVVVTLAILTLLFALIFKMLPDAKAKWRAIWMGSAFTAVLFLIGEYLLSWYFNRQSPASSYGAAGSVVVLLTWIYYSSLIVFFGAEFIQAYAKQAGAEILPTERAEPIVQPTPFTPKARPAEGAA